VLADSVESIVDDSMELSLLSPCIETNPKTRKSRSGRAKAKRRSADNKFVLTNMPPKFACGIINDMMCACSDESLKLREKLFESTKAIEFIEGALHKSMNFIGKALDNQTVRASMLRLLTSLMSAFYLSFSSRLLYNLLKILKSTLF
jgi:hypothetical protein